jgi:hypothetical protein
VRLAIATTGWNGDDAATHSWGITTAPLPCLGHAGADSLATVAVVVDGTVVVESADVVVVVGGIIVVVVEVEVEVVVDVGDVVVVVVVGVTPLAQ